MRSLCTLALGIALSATATPALADRMWLLPSATSLSGNAPWVTIDAGLSNDVFVADHAMRLDTLVITAPDGGTVAPDTPTTLHSRAVFDVRLDKPGTWKIGTAQTGIIGSFKVGDVEWRVGGRRGPVGPGGPPAASGAGGPPPGFQPRPGVATIAEIPADATDITLTETISLNAVFVTAGAPTKTVFAVTGKGLEMVPITHPDELVSNERASFRFLLDGKPAAALKVTLIPGGGRFRASDGAFEVTTGADGIARVSWPMAAMYWLNATLNDAHPSEPRATTRRLSYTATLEVMAP